MMPFDTLRVTLVRARDDDASFSARYQQELKAFYQLVRADGTRMSAVAFTMAGVDGDSGFTGEFVVPLGQDVGTVLGRAALAWMQGRPGRTVLITLGDLHFDVGTLTEFEALISKARAMKTVPLSKGRHNG